MCKKEDCNTKANNKKFGGYCYKHRRKYLMDDDYRKHSCPMIIFDHWTNKCSDYLRTDIISYLRDNWYLYESQYNGINLTDKSKQELFILLASKMNSLKKYDEKDIQRIIQLQIKIKNKKTNLLNRLRGEGYKDKIKCNNESDFYTYDLLSEMDGKYFFSYKDDNDFIWFFDIRSFNKLIEMNHNNPYTREEIPHHVKVRARNLSKVLKLTKEDELINNENIQLNQRQIIKQKTIDIFSQMEQFGFGCDINWFLQLNVRKLRNLYRNLEDIWSYRLNLSYEKKSQISPPNGIVFNIPIVEVNNTSSILQLQDIILNEVMKFNNAVSDEDKKLGFMYFLLGMGLVSRECYEIHQWIIHAVY